MLLQARLRRLRARRRNNTHMLCFGRSLRPACKVAVQQVCRSCDAACLMKLLGWPQDALHKLVPWLIIALADREKGKAAAPGRLKAAAMQLLPPLLDGMHARRLAGLSDAALSTARLPLKQFFDTLVGAAFRAYSVLQGFG